MRDPNATREDYKAAIDIAEFIGQYVDLEERSDGFWGLSPFKQERTPSFSVEPEKDVFYDFSSGLGGDVYSFVRHYFKCSHEEALDILNDYVESGGNSVIVKRLCATTVCRMYKRKNPKENVPVNISSYPPNQMDLYEKRDSVLSIWKKEGISQQSLDKFQVRYDGMARRIVYPVRDYKGKIVNIGGRTVDPDFQSRGTKKYIYYGKWGRMDTIYGYFENFEAIKEAGEIILFEGAKSVMLADTWGIHNTGAILCSHLNELQLKALIRLGVKVVFALDKNVDITKDKNIKKLKRYTEVFYIKDCWNQLGPKDAPVDSGKEVFDELYKQRFRLN